MTKTKKPLQPTRKLSVRAIIIESETMLLCRQGKRLQWHAPGGTVEPGEKPYIALKRECEDETGIKILKSRLLLTICIKNGRGKIIETIMFYQVLSFKNFENRRPDGKEIAELGLFSFRDPPSITLTNTMSMALGYEQIRKIVPGLAKISH